MSAKSKGDPLVAELQDIKRLLAKDDPIVAELKQIK